MINKEGPKNTAQFLSFNLSFIKELQRKYDERALKGNVLLGLPKFKQKSPSESSQLNDDL